MHSNYCQFGPGAEPRSPAFAGRFLPSEPTREFPEKWEARHLLGRNLLLSIGATTKDFSLRFLSQASNHSIMHPSLSEIVDHSNWLMT